MSRRAQILSLLQSGRSTTSTLSYLLDAPEPSIRRDIQQLRREGHNISFADANGVYCYERPSSAVVPDVENRGFDV